MSYNEYKNTYIDINECTSRGACTISPTIASLQEVALLFLQQLAYYVLRLEKLGASNKNIKYEIITILSSLVSVNEFSDNQLYSIILKEYYMLEDAKKTYSTICKQEKIIQRDLKKITQFKPTTTVAQAISFGEKIFLEKYRKRTTEEKNLTEILLIILKSVSLNLTKINDFNDFDEGIYHEILETLDMFNNNKISVENIEEKTNKLAIMDKNLQLRISELLLNAFGGIKSVQVSHSTRKGKAILVSGNNFFDLLNILEETKEKDIDIYTHSNLLITHSLNRFHEYNHLRGHYGDLTENCILDFATFPGSILLTKNSRNNREYLYRGRLFSTDYIVANGVIQIENNDYSELIDAAKNAKGFSKGKTKDDTNLGYNENELDEKIEDIVEKLNNNTIEKLYIIGMDAQLEVQKEYFKEFFARMQNNEFAISFSYESPKDNVLTIPVGNYIPIATSILKKIFDKYPISSEKIVFFFTTCDVMTISSIITLSDLKAKNIYMAQCPPIFINPSVFTTLRKNYNVELTEDAANDLEKIRRK